MEETTKKARRYILENVGNYNKEIIWECERICEALVLERVPVKEVGLGSKERRDAVTVLLRSVSNLWILPLVRKPFTSVKERSL